MFSIVSFNDSDNIVENDKNPIFFSGTQVNKRVQEEINNQKLHFFPIVSTRSARGVLVGCNTFRKKHTGWTYSFVSSTRPWIFSTRLPYRRRPGLRACKCDLTNSIPANFGGRPSAVRLGNLCFRTISRRNWTEIRRRLCPAKTPLFSIKQTNGRQCRWWWR